MGITYHNQDVPGFKYDKKRIKETLGELIQTEKKIPGKITIIFCSDEYLYQINCTYLKHEYFTDIITFDYSEKNILSGDVFISVDRVRENALTYQTTFDAELYRVIYHGILHLAGYNDKTVEDKKIMRERENFYLHQFGI